MRERIGFGLISASSIGSRPGRPDSPLPGAGIWVASLQARPSFFEVKTISPPKAVMSKIASTCR